MLSMFGRFHRIGPVGLVIALGLLALAFAGGLPLIAHSGDASIIHSCVNDDSGEIQIIGADDQCGNHRSLDWSITGPPGVDGADGDKGDKGDTGPSGPAGPGVQDGSASATATAFGPGNQGGPYSVECPSGTVAIGINGRAGVFVDRIGLICSAVEFVPLANGVGARLVGPTLVSGTPSGAGGTPFSHECTPGSVLVGVKGIVQSFGSLPTPIILSAQGQCQQLSGTGISTTGTAGIPTFPLPPLPPIPYSLTCANSGIATGLSGNFNFFVSSIRVDCN